MDEFDDLLDDAPGGAFLFEEEDLDEYDDLDEDDLSDDDDADDPADDAAADPSRLAWAALGAAAGAALLQPARSASEQSRWITQYLPGMQRVEPAPAWSPTCSSWRPSRMPPPSSGSGRCGRVATTRSSSAAGSSTSPAAASTWQPPWKR